MDKIEHKLLIVEWVNALLGHLVAAALAPLGFTLTPEEAIPSHIVMGVLMVAALAVLCLFVRSRLSVENPGPLQIILEDGVSALRGLMTEYIGPKGPTYLPLVGTLFVFILVGNLMGLVPGLMAPTANINVTVGCALTSFVYYQIQGFKEQGIVGYFKHFLAPPGAPMWIAPIYFPIEIISHFSRILSLSVRLFGNIFGEELVIAILFSIIPFLLPLPMMLLGIITSGLQAFIFAILTIIYLSGAVAVEHADDHAHGDQGHGGAAELSAA